VVSRALARRLTRSATRALERRLQIVCGVLCLGVLAAAPPGCQRDEHRAPPEAGGEIPAQVVERLTLRESDAGRLRWVLAADSALVFGERRPTLLRGVHVDFFTDGGDSVRSTLSAREGEIDEVRGDLLARGSVLVVTREGQRLETEELRWEKQREKVVAEGFVRLTKGESVVTGVGLESDAGLRNYTLRSRVEGVLQEKDDLLEGL